MRGKASDELPAVAWRVVALAIGLFCFGRQTERAVFDLGWHASSAPNAWSWRPSVRLLHSQSVLPAPFGSPEIRTVVSPAPRVLLDANATTPVSASTAPPEAPSATVGGGSASSAHAHKALFPLNSYDIGLFVITAVALFIAAGAGIGGGPILVPVLLLLGGFSQNAAVALSNTTICAGSVANVAVNARRRHPSRNKPLVDWDLILLMEPPTVLGAIAGSYLNKVMPVWISRLLLALLLMMMTWRMVQRATSLFRRETLARLAAAAAAPDGGRREAGGGGPCGGAGCRQEDEAAGRAKAGLAPLGGGAGGPPALPPTPGSRRDHQVRQRSMASAPPAAYPQPQPPHAAGPSPQRASDNAGAAGEQTPGGNAMSHQAADSLAPGGDGVCAAAWRGGRAPRGCAEAPQPADSRCPSSMRLNIELEGGVSYDGGCARGGGDGSCAAAPAPPAGWQQQEAADEQNHLAAEGCLAWAGMAPDVANSEAARCCGGGSCGVVDAATAAAQLAAGQTPAAKAVPEVAAANGVAYELEAMLAEETQQVPPRAVALLAFMFAVVLATSLGTKALSCGSAGHWALQCSVAPVLVGVWLFARRRVLRKAALLSGAQAGEGELRWTRGNTLLFPAVCSLAGVVAGMFGLGGAVVKTPLMLELGVHPQVTAATTQTMLLFTTATATITYAQMGDVVWDYACAMALLALAATLVGQALIDVLVRRLGRASVVVIVLCGFFTVASVMTAYLAVRSLRDALAVPSLLSAVGRVCPTAHA